MFHNVTPALPKGDRSVCAIAIDAEEDFDWLNPVYGTGYTTGCMKSIRGLQEIVGAYGIAPTYLLTYPVLEDRDVVRLIRRQLDRGECEVGVQLHPWVTPPYDPDAELASSFPGNLLPALEDRKLLAMIEKFEECFAMRPRIYRAGRYGLGSHTAQLLEKHGFTIDISLAPRTDFTADGGPDYSSQEYRPFWFGEHDRILELPLCRSIVGWGGPAAPAIYQALADPALINLRMLTLLTRSRCAERITLSPEGNDLAAMIRLLRRLHAGGHRLFALSFHSSSLAVGRNPYVQNKAELHAFYDRLSAILDFMATRLDMQFATIGAMPGFLQAPAS